MDIEIYRYPAVAVFSIAFALEIALTGKLFLERGSVNISPLLKWWAVIALGCMSLANMFAAIEVLQSSRADTVHREIAFSLAGLFLLLWVFVFHLDKWKKK